MTERCTICGGQLAWQHDHQADQRGLDDGPPLRGERRKPAPKPPEELRAIRIQAWATRRAKLGPRGHR